LMDR